MPERSDETQLSLDGLPLVFAQSDLNFCEGNPITQDLDVIDIPFTNQYQYSFTDNLVVAPIIGLLLNSKVRKLFATLDIDNIQYFPAHLRDIDSGQINSDYSLANIVGKIFCVDKSLSELDLFDDGDIRFIDKLVLSLDDNKDYGHIFRLADFISLLVISDKLKQVLENNQVTGFG